MRSSHHTQRQSRLSSLLCQHSWHGVCTCLPARMPPLTADCDTGFSCRLIHLQASQCAQELLPCMSTARQTTTCRLPCHPCGDQLVSFAGAPKTRDLTPEPAFDKGAAPPSWTQEVHRTLGRRLLPVLPSLPEQRECILSNDAATRQVHTVLSCSSNW